MRLSSWWFSDFLGDLVSKGPDSAGVVQLAREIGALGVRGNHDFEVLRLHAALTQDIHVSQAKQLSNLEHATISPMLTKKDVA